MRKLPQLYIAKLLVVLLEQLIKTPGLREFIFKYPRIPASNVKNAHQAARNKKEPFISDPHSLSPFSHGWFGNTFSNFKEGEHLCHPNSLLALYTAAVAASSLPWKNPFYEVILPWRRRRRKEERKRKTRKGIHPIHSWTKIFKLVDDFSFSVEKL